MLSKLCLETISMTMYLILCSKIIYETMPWAFGVRRWVFSRTAESLWDLYVIINRISFGSNEVIGAAFGILYAQMT